MPVQWGYTRISTAEQSNNLQVDALLRAGVRRHRIVADVVSGTRPAAQRPGMKKLLERAESGDTVVVWRIDRLGRSTLDVLKTVDMLNQRGIRLHSLVDNIDPSTPEGRMALTLVVSLASYEAELNRSRIIEGMRAAKARGTKFGRPRLDQKIVAEKVRIARTLMASGTPSAQAAELIGWSRATLYRHMANHPDVLPLSDMHQA